MGILRQQVGAGEHVGQLSLRPAVLHADGEGLDAGGQQLIAGGNQFVPGLRHFDAIGSEQILVVEHADNLLLVVGNILFAADLADFGISQIIQFAVFEGQQRAAGHEIGGVLHDHDIRELVRGQQGLLILKQGYVGGGVAVNLDLHVGMSRHIAVSDALPEFQRQLGLDVHAECDLGFFRQCGTARSAYQQDTQQDGQQFLHFLLLPFLFIKFLSACALLACIVL